MVRSADCFTKIFKYFKLQNINYVAYQLKQKRSYRVVVKDIHHVDFLTLGHNVRNVTNDRSRIVKLPLPMFFMDLDTNPNNKGIFNIKSINNAIVVTEVSRKIDDLVQWRYWLLQPISQDYWPSSSHYLCCVC